MTVASYIIRYRSGRLINNERGWEWDVVRSDGVLMASGWSAGRKRDATSDAQAVINRLHGADILRSLGDMP